MFCFLSISNLEKKEFPPASGNPFFNQKTVMNLKEWFGFFFLSQEGNIHKIFRIRELETSKLVVDQNHPDELFVVDISLRVFLTMDQTFNIFLRHSFSQTCQKMSQFS